MLSRERGNGIIVGSYGVMDCIIPPFPKIAPVRQCKALGVWFSVACVDLQFLSWIPGSTQRQAARLGSLVVDTNHPLVINYDK